MLWFWWGLFVFLVLAEFIIPGLVVMFVGMGAGTVAVFMHYGLIDGIIQQFLVWFASSLIYIFSLRLVVMHYYPSDQVQYNIDEDLDVKGQEAEVVKTIPKDGVGRISHSDSSWNAKSEDGSEIKSGQKVEIVSRDNITWIVKKI